MKKSSLMSALALAGAMAAGASSAGAQQRQEALEPVNPERDAKTAATQSCLKSGNTLVLQTLYAPSASDLDRDMARTGKTLDELKTVFYLAAERALDAEFDSLFARYTEADFETPKFGEELNQAVQRAQAKTEQETGITLRIPQGGINADLKPGCAP